MSTTLTPGEMLRRRATESTIALAEHVERWDPVARMLAPAAGGVAPVFCELPSRLLGGYRQADGAVILNAGGFHVGPDDLWADDNEQARVYASLEGILSRAAFARKLAKAGAIVPDAADHVAAAALDAALAKTDKKAKEALRRAGLADIRALAGMPTRVRSVVLLAANSAIRYQAGLLSEAEADPICRLALDVLPAEAVEEFSLLIRAGAAEGAEKAATISLAVQALASKTDRGLDDSERPAFHAAYRALIISFQNAEPPGETVLERYRKIVDKLVAQGVAHGIPTLRKLLLGQDLGPVGAGCEGSHFVTDSAGDEWVVKGHGGRGELCFVEALSSLLAQYLGVLTPTAGALKQGDEILFASRRVAVSKPKGRERVSAVDAAGIAVLDALIANSDRHDANVVLEEQGGQYRIWAIDHGHALRGLLESPRGGKDPFVSSHVACADTVCRVKVDPAEKKRILGRLRSLPESHVKAMVRRMPAEWRQGISADVLNAIPARIAARANNLLQAAVS